MYHFKRKSGLFVRMTCEHPKLVMLVWIEFLLSMHVCRNTYSNPADFDVNQRPFSSIFLDKRGDYFVTFSRKPVISLHVLVSTEYWPPCPKKNLENTLSQPLLLRSSSNLVYIFVVTSTRCPFTLVRFVAF